MKQNLYIFSDSRIRRKQNTLWLERVLPENGEENLQSDTAIQQDYLLGEDILLPSGETKCIPVEGINSVIAFGTVSFNSRLMHFLSQNQIPLHVFSMKGNYGGSFLPGGRSTSGVLLLKQAAFCTDENKRMEIARKITSASISNSLANLHYYQNRGADTTGYAHQVEEIQQFAENASTASELMGLEGAAKKLYYSSWSEIFRQPVEFKARVKNPPDNLINALISYGNMVVYSVCLNEIFHTRLYPELGFVHQPGENKMSLCYDLADIFKPILTDRAIFTVINKNIISEKDAVIRNKRCILKKEAKQKFVQELDKRLMKKITIEGKASKYSYRRVIREECYKLIRHLMGEDDYEPFITRW